MDPAGRPGGDRLSRALRRSTMGAGAFHGRVRDGIGCGVPAMATGPPGRILSRGVRDRLCRFGSGRVRAARCCVRCPFRDVAAAVGSELIRAIRTARLRRLPDFHLRPIDVLVLHGPRGDLVSRGVSRLDAFSGYPVRAWLPGGAAGATTGAPEARPSRSSRTGDGASQVSCTHGR